MSVRLTRCACRGFDLSKRSWKAILLDTSEHRVLAVRILADMCRFWTKDQALPNLGCTNQLIEIGGVVQNLQLNLTNRAVSLR